MSTYENLTRRSVIVGSLALAATLLMPSIAQAWYTPKRGTEERADILDAIRPVVEAQMDVPVEFVILEMRVDDGWAFVIADPQHRGGAPIDPGATRFGENASFMDGLTVYALVRWTNGRWNLIEHVVGPTDVAYEPWPQFYGAPPEIFGF